jgi:PEP-CTERM motif
LLQPIFISRLNDGILMVQVLMGAKLNKEISMPLAISFRKAALSGAALLLFVMAGSVARADQVFAINSSIVGTGAVNATATFHQSGTNLLQITLTNLQSTDNVGQAVSGITFQIRDSGGNVLNITGAISTQSNPLILVAGGGGATPMGTLTTGWGLSSNGPSFTLTALGFTGNGTNPPDEVIVGPLSGPNSSIAGNGPHNPFIDQNGVFTLTLSQNLPAGFQITKVVLLFGTGPDSVPATPTSVPEPASLFLLGTGLVGIAATFRRRLARSKNVK